MWLLLWFLVRVCSSGTLVSVYIPVGQFRGPTASICSTCKLNAAGKQLNTSQVIASVPTTQHPSSATASKLFEEPSPGTMKCYQRHPSKVDEQ